VFSRGSRAEARRIATVLRTAIDTALTGIDVTGTALLGGVGFTASLLIGEFAVGAGDPRDDHVKVAVPLGSLTAAVFAAVVLRLRNRTYRRLHPAENIAEHHETRNG
jgi:NhaA family Na+:H+ antiporter